MQTSISSYLPQLIEQGSKSKVYDTRSSAQPRTITAIRTPQHRDLLPLLAGAPCAGRVVGWRRRIGTRCPFLLRLCSISAEQDESRSNYAALLFWYIIAVFMHSSFISLNVSSQHMFPRKMLVGLWIVSIAIRPGIEPKYCGGCLPPAGLIWYIGLDL